MNKNLTTAVTRSNNPTGQHGRFNATSQSSRFNFTIKGPNLWGAQTSGFIEIDFDSADPQLQMVVNLPWIQGSSWTMSFHLGIGGLSILLVLLTTFLAPISILSTWKAIEERVKEFMIFFLLLEVGMLGVFLAQDLFCGFSRTSQKGLLSLQCSAPSS